MCVDVNLTINATIKLTNNDRAANRYAINGSGVSACIDMTNGKAYASQPIRSSHNMLGIP